ncbi:hypothetical protein D3C72_1763900 [compost metagenome]
MLMCLPVVFRIITVAVGHKYLAHRRAVQRHMLTDIGTSAHHAGGGLQLVDQNNVVVFTAGEVYRLPHLKIELLQMWCGNVDNIQRRKRFLADRNELGGQAIAAGRRRLCHISAGMQPL